jgi:hypothetical protein
MILDLISFILLVGAGVLTYCIIVIVRNTND